MSGPRLSVNIDHVATVRQARRASYPDPVEAARLALAAGAAGITVHLRVDRRHIQDADLHRLREDVREKLNVEMSTAEEMVEIALAVRPDQVTLVAERPEEVTTEGGLDLVAQGARVLAVSERLRAAGIEVSVFLDPDPPQIEALARLAGIVSGFELNTDVYTRANPSGVEAELGRISRAAAAGRERGFRLYAGHGLTTANVGPIAQLPGMEELNIGHFLVARAVLVGMTEAVREMLVVWGNVDVGNRQGATMKIFTAVIERDPETSLYVGYVPGFPGAHSQGVTLDELNANLREVIEMLLEDGEPNLDAEFVGTQNVLLS